MLKIKGIPDKRCDWITEIMIVGHVGMRVNDNIGSYFKIFKGMRQGDALSPFFFDIANDALPVIINNTKENGLVKGGI